MTWLGKILSVFVLILGVAAMWFITTVFVARTNWKKDRDAYQALYKEAETARASELSAYRSEKDALERRLVAEETRGKGLAETVAKLKGSNDLVSAENQRLAKIIKDTDVLGAELLALLQALTDEVNQTRKRGVLLEVERVDLVTKKENAEKDRQTFENLAKQAISDRLVAEGKIDNLNTQLAEIKAAGGNPSALLLNSFGKPPAPLPDGIRGTVKVYKDGWAELSIGIDAGLTIGASLDVFRSEGGGQYLGTVVIVSVYPKDAVARFKPADPRRSIEKLRPEELPKAGDIVGKVGVGGPISLKP